MIKTIRTKDVYDVIKTITSITSLVTVFNQKPSEEYINKNIPNWSYIYFSKITDTPTTASFSWYMQKIARLQFNIVSKTNFWAWESAESILMDIIDAINNAIANESCLKITTRWVQVSSVLEDVQSPIFYWTKDRPYIAKDYLFIYWGIDD